MCNGKQTNQPTKNKNRERWVLLGRPIANLLMQVLATKGVRAIAFCLPINVAPNTFTFHSNSSSEEKSPGCAQISDGSADNPCKKALCLSRMCWDLFILRPFFNLSSFVCFACLHLPGSHISWHTHGHRKGNLLRTLEYSAGGGMWSMSVSLTLLVSQATATSLPTASLAPQAFCGQLISSRVFRTLPVSRLLCCWITLLSFSPYAMAILTENVAHSVKYLPSLHKAFGLIPRAADTSYGGTCFYF